MAIYNVNLGPIPINASYVHVPLVSQQNHTVHFNDVYMGNPNTIHFRLELIASIWGISILIILNQNFGMQFAALLIRDEDPNACH